ncbi:unknown [Bacillus sp. CAG:988]|nr:unknown [Bacillus sp. CAG:988]
MKKKIIIVSGILILTVLLIALGFSILNDSYNSNGISFIENTKLLQNYQIKLDISIDEETSVGATFNIHANTQDVALTLTRQGMPLTSYYLLNYETSKATQQNIANANPQVFDTSLNVTDIFEIIKADTWNDENATFELETNLLATKLIAVNNLIQMFPSFFDFDNQTKIVATVTTSNEQIFTIDFDINQMHFHFEIMDSNVES